MTHSTISLGLGLGGGKASTSSGRLPSGGAFSNTLSASFDGTDDYLVIPDNSAFSLGDGAGNDNAFSISSWFKADSIGNFYMATKDAANREWSFRTFLSQLHFFAFGTGGGYIGRKYATNLSAGQWYHAVVTYDASKASSGIKLYLNGSRVDDGDYAGGTYTAAVNTTTSIRVGSLEHNNTFADGKVDELAIFDSELSASDVTAIYNSGVPADLSSYSPVGWWRMGDGTGDTDSGSGAPASGDTIGTVVNQGSASSSDATGTNGALYSDDVPVASSFSNTYSVDFDGTDDYMDCGSVTQINSVTNLSTSSWFKIDAYQSGGGPIILGGQSVPGSNGFYLQALDASTIRFAHQDYGAYDNFTGISVPVNTWHHVVTVQSGTSLTIYLNGTSVGTATVTAVDSGWGSNFTIGKWSAGNFNYMNGHIDEVALFTSALSASDVTAIYNSGTPADLSSLSPIGWWRMGDNDGGSGTTITDQGSGGNDGTLTNGPIFSTDVPPSTNTYSVDFDGTDDYMDLGTTSALNPTSSLTVSAWVKADSHTNTSGVYDSIYSSSKDSGGANGGFVLVNNLNKWKCYFYSGTTWYAVESDNNVVDGQWYHLASTWDGTTAKLYVNGSVQTSTASVSSITYFTAVSAKVGSYYTGSYLNGLIDEVSLFDSALSASDITSMYNSGVPNDISSLSPIGWWRMGDGTEAGSGTTVYDMSSNSNNGTLTNGPTFSTTVPS